MRELNQNQTGDELSKYKQRIKMQLDNVSNGNYEYTEEIKSFLGFASNELINGNKCIVVQGNVGSGKSIIMRVLAETFISPKRAGAIKYATSIDITDAFRQHGHEAIKKYLSGNIVIDEIGLEPSPTKVPYESTYINVIEYLFLKRYDSYINSGGRIRTHFITNLSDSELSAFYGERFMSRLELLRAKKTVIGGSAEYKDYRKSGVAFHYKPFDWDAYETSEKIKQYKDIDALIAQSIKDDIELFKMSKPIYDAGSIKWKYLIRSNDARAIEIQNSNAIKETTFDDVISGRQSESEKRYINWLNYFII